MRIGSLFSGIGGLELGLEWSGLGHTVWQVERDEYCRAVLARHWPDAERFDDVRTVGAHCLAPVDVICGGFPCQDVSSAGRRAGLDGARSGLWAEFFRVLGEALPGWVVVENVASGATLWLDEVTADLARLGYAVLPIPIEAQDCGAPHHRARVFLVGCRTPDSDGQYGATRVRLLAEPAKIERSAPLHRRVARWPCVRSDIPGLRRVADGIRGRLDSPPRRVRALGNAVVPTQAEVVGHVVQILAGRTGQGV